MVYFEKIEVVNQLSEAFVINTTRRFGLEYDKNLIFDKVHHEINQLCSRSTLQVPPPPPPPPPPHTRRRARAFSPCEL